MSDQPPPQYDRSAPGGAADSPQVPLPLQPDAQWFLHHLVVVRLRRGGPPVADVPRNVARRVRDKLEAGELAFAAAELRYLRYELVRYLRGPDPTPRNAATARRTVDSVDRALGRRSRI